MLRDTGKCDAQFCLVGRSGVISLIAPPAVMSITGPALCPSRQCILRNVRLVIEGENQMKKTITLSLLLSLAIPFAAAADNAAVYKAKCAACHGADGSGQTAMGKKMNLRDLSSPEVQKQSDADLTKITTDGKAKMPAYGTKLTAEEIKGLVTFIRELAPKK